MPLCLKVKVRLIMLLINAHKFAYFASISEYYALPIHIEIINQQLYCIITVEENYATTKMLAKLLSSLTTEFKSILNKFMLAHLLCYAHDYASIMCTSPLKGILSLALGQVMKLVHVLRVLRSNV